MRGNKKIGALRLEWIVLAWLALPAVAADSQIIEGRSVPVLIAETDASADLLVVTVTGAELASELDQRSDAGLRDTAKIQRPAYLITSRDTPKGAGSYDGLPLCAYKHSRIESSIKHELVEDGLDIVVYQNENEDQKREARQTGAKPVPFIEGDLINPHRNPEDKLQPLLRSLNLLCVPTRVRVILREKEQRIEYREGELAFTALGR